jgi:hypothetical protein
MARLYNEHGSLLATVPLGNVTPTEAVLLETEVTSSEKPARISLHLEDYNGLDRGALQEVRVGSEDHH